ncbi:PREDICTED: thyrotropin-releasing hormone receptor-like [Trachymyrmex septentrionalis]|uniref:thyrotropin-releasing hormone receptor-like n=1 Tax=Trachymyrmex septentrionalis TaxID=34720 RepID=UPI00084F2365|nr:PREDICTED: thyrotropin-releasing hormone receptor-like [Trachymyrmex septentrionalis]XP_018340180.1 PREDICTED: thyrotropin-releasing hormone receptor-like [Trachymyrmex septentrionalis]
MITGNNSTIANEFYCEINGFFQNIQRYYAPILVFLGLLGNCMSVFVFFGTKLRYSSSSIYLGALAISDSGFLMTVFVSWLKMVHVDLFNRQGFCQFFIYLASLCSFLSVWFVVAFTVERYVAVKWPLRRQFWCTVARAKMIVVGFTALAVLLTSPVAVFSKISENSTDCGYLDKEWESWAIPYNVIDNVVTFAVPLTIIVIFNTLIARNIYKLDHIRRTLTIESDVSNERAPRDRMPQTKVTKMLLLVSSAFFCLNMPAFVFRVIAVVGNDKVPDNNKSVMWLIWAQQMSQLLFDTSFGINFILYCASGQNFRREIVYICTKRSSTRRNGTLVQMTIHGKQCEFMPRCNSTKRLQFINAQQKNFQETQKFPVKGL